MSVTGHLRRFRGHPAHVRFAPDSDHRADIRQRQKSAKTGREQLQQIAIEG